MILVTTETISGKELETLGLVRGSTIQSKNIGRDITQGFKTLVGGELKAYTEMMNEARAIATKRMVEDAEGLGAGRRRLHALRLLRRHAGRRRGDRLRHRRPSLNKADFHPGPRSERNRAVNPKD